MLKPPNTVLLATPNGVVPFLKWLGGKRWLLRQGLTVPVLEPGATYFEPFVGAGSLFFALAPTRAVLSDVNPELIATYRSIKNRVEAVIGKLESLPCDLPTYNAIKASRPKSELERAVRLLYLNRTAYGGVYRVNRKGEFNVPFGNYSDRRVCQPSVLREASTALAGAQLHTCAYARQLTATRPGDFVYLDPPYNARDSLELFGRYHSKIFTWKMHQKLAQTAIELAKRGVHVLVSNIAHDDVIDLYPDFNVTELKKVSQLNPDRLLRAPTAEVLLSSYEIKERSSDSRD